MRPCHLSLKLNDSNEKFSSEQEETSTIISVNKNHIDLMGGWVDAVIT